MEYYSAELSSLKKELEQLPKGNVTYKTIRGKRRMYLQWTEGGKRRSRYIRADEEDSVTAQLVRRRMVEERIRMLSAPLNYEPAGDLDMSYGLVAEEEGRDLTGTARRPAITSRSLNVATGRLLESMTLPVRTYQRRDCYRILDSYLNSDNYGRVCIIYGLRRTGKTTMLLQAISDLPADRTAYIKVNSADTMDGLNRDLRSLAAAGFKYIFIDEVTLLKDFIDSASLLSDIYAQAGVKIVLSGTDSLGFALSSDDELYDREVTIHTTFIPFREYHRLLGIKDIDEYIRYGGTLRRAESGAYDQIPSPSDRTFENDESTRRYIDAAIVHNIQHSLINYRYGRNLRHLAELYEADELTGAVNRIIEDMNHRFVLSVFEREWESHDLGSARQMLRHRSALEGKVSPLDEIDAYEVTARIKSALEILDADERSVTLTEDHISEIKEYLRILDIVADCPYETAGASQPSEHMIFTQPGMRYCQAEALVRSVMKDERFTFSDPQTREAVSRLILSDVRGRMLEDQVLLETNKSLRSPMRAFKMLFAIGEIDMVVYDRSDLTCRLYEIKHSDQKDPMQYRHMADEKKCEEIERRFGKVISRTVLYRGPACTVDAGDLTIEYINVEDYLDNLL